MIRQKGKDVYLNKEGNIISFKDYYHLWNNSKVLIDTKPL